MKTTNHVEIQGFASRDPEKKSDRAPVRFGIATGNDTRPDGRKNPLCFHTVTAWDRQPEVLKIKKGDYVKVVGRLSYTKWTDKDGIERTGVEVVAESVTVLPKDSQSEPRTKPPAQPNNPDRPGQTTNIHGVNIDDRDLQF